MNLIQGRPLLGFWGIFEGCYGDESTESPMRTITPSFVGGSMLPFRCARCKDVCQDLACPVTREHYKDTREGRDNHFCSRCGCRFKIDMAGTPLPCALSAGAVVGPSKVECDGTVTWQDRDDNSILGTILGTILGALSKPSTNGYRALGHGI